MPEVLHEGATGQHGAEARQHGQADGAAFTQQLLNQDEVGLRRIGGGLSTASLSDQRVEPVDRQQQVGHFQPVS